MNSFQDQKKFGMPVVRGLQEFSIPCDPAGFTGVNGIHFNRTFTDFLIIGALPVAAAGGVAGASYLSPMHGAVGSDSPNNTNPGAPASNVPAFAGPEVTGYATGDPLTDGYQNTEKVQRSPSDGAPAGSGTIWVPTFGTTRLSVSLSVYTPTTSNIFVLYVFRDCNVGDKVAGRLGAGTGPADVLNAQLVAMYGPFLQSQDGEKMPAFQTAEPLDLQAVSNLYLVLRNISSAVNTNEVIGSFSLKG